LTGSSAFDSRCACPDDVVAGRQSEDPKVPTVVGNFVSGQLQIDTSRCRDVAQRFNSDACAGLTESIQDLATNHSAQRQPDRQAADGLAIENGDGRPQAPPWSALPVSPIQIPVTSGLKCAATGWQIAKGKAAHRIT
jgi:hypothetical protein